MRNWLTVAAVLPLFATTAAKAQMQGLLATDVASVARARAVDLRIAEQQGFDRPLPLISGMVVQQEVSANASVGLGLANMYSRKKGGLRLNEAPGRSRKPAVTFIMKF